MRRDLKFVWVSHVSDVFRAALADPEPIPSATLNRDIRGKNPLLQPT